MDTTRHPAVVGAVIAALTIDPMGHRFKVVGIDAIPYSAQVVQFEPGWHLANKRGVGIDMGGHKPLAVAERSVPCAVVCPTPEPARLSLPNPGPEAEVGGPASAPRWGPGPPPACVMESAPGSIPGWPGTFWDCTSGTVVAHRELPPDVSGRAVYAAPLT